MTDYEAGHVRTWRNDASFGHMAAFDYKARVVTITTIPQDFGMHRSMRHVLMTRN